MTSENEKLYGEAGIAWRHFALWREKTLAGYVTVLAGLGVAVSHSESLRIRAALFVGGVVVSTAFWILDVRNNQLLNECEGAAGSLEGVRGVYSALAGVRSALGRVWGTYSVAIDILVCTVVAAGCAGALIQLVRLCHGRWVEEPWAFVCLGGAVVVAAFLLVCGARRIRPVVP